MSNTIAVVIPYYNASNHIVEVVKSIPNIVNYIIIVDDRSEDVLPHEEVSKNIKDGIELVILKSEINKGVGGATVIGYNKAMELDVEYVVKIDADNQMDLSYLPIIKDRIEKSNADVVKGNRFKDLKALRNMPKVRRIGNLVLTFLIKIATGYWGVFDPTNGYFIVRTDLLRKMDFSRLHNRYYFETSLLAEYYFHKAIVVDVSMPAIYGDEKSSMQVWKMPFLFLKELPKTFLRRILKEYFLYNFNIASVYILLGFPLFSLGVISGAYNWWYYGVRNILAPTGTIMFVTLSIILGFQLLLQAIQFDIENSPK